jgi:mannosyltransferase
MVGGVRPARRAVFAVRTLSYRTAACDPREARPARAPVSPTDPTVPSPRAPRGEALLVGAIVLFAAVVRVAQARGASLWLDELHTWYHASAPSLAAMLERLRADNHPPLAVLLVRSSRAAFGESELALRLPSLLAGVLGVLVTAWLARRHLGPRARWIAPLLVAASSLHLAASAEARMYALLALFTALALDGALRVAHAPDPRAARGGAWELAAALALAFHTHYHAVHVAVALGAGLVAAAPRPNLRALVAPALAAAAACAPWAVWGLAEQLRHGLPPGGAGGTLRGLASGYAQLLFHDASLAGPLRPAFLVGALVALALAARGAAPALRRAPDAAGLRGRRTARLLAALAFGLPLWSAGVAMLMPRAGFHWVYLTPAVVPFALLIAAAADRPGSARAAAAERAAVGAVALLAIALALLHLPGRSREETRAAVRALLSELRPGDAVIAGDWQPPLFPHGLAWRYYAPRLGGAAPGVALEPVAVGPDLALSAPAELDGVARAFVIGRSLPDDAPLLLELRRRYAHEDVHRFGDAIFVHRFTR